MRGNLRLLDLRDRNRKLSNLFDSTRLWDAMVMMRDGEMDWKEEGGEVNVGGFEG